MQGPVAVLLMLRCPEMWVSGGSTRVPGSKQARCYGKIPLRRERSPPKQALENPRIKPFQASARALLTNRIKRNKEIERTIVFGNTSSGGVWLLRMSDGTIDYAAIFIPASDRRKPDTKGF